MKNRINTAYLLFKKLKYDSNDLLYEFVGALCDLLKNLAAVLLIFTLTGPCFLFRLLMIPCIITFKYKRFTYWRLLHWKRRTTPTAERKSRNRGSLRQKVKK